MREAAARVSSHLRSVLGDDQLRCVVAYEPDEFHVEFVRSDVAREEARFDRLLDDARLESISAPYVRSLVPESHGDLRCQVRCFETAIELNFVTGDGRGVLVSVDAGAFREQSTLIGRLREVVRGDREPA
jgi:hypothetical protein